MVVGVDGGALASDEPEHGDFATVAGPGEAGDALVDVEHPLGVSVLASYLAGGDSCGEQPDRADDDCRGRVRLDQVSHRQAAPELDQLIDTLPSAFAVALKVPEPDTETVPLPDLEAAPETLMDPFEVNVTFALPSQVTDTEVVAIFG